MRATRRAWVAFVVASIFGVGAWACAQSDDGTATPPPGDEAGPGLPASDAAVTDGGVSLLGDGGLGGDARLCSLDHWCPLAVSSPPLRAVWGSGPDDVWIAGDYGLLLHWDGQSLTKAVSGTSEPLLALWGRAPNDVWAVGWGGTALHWDGASWSSRSATAGYDFNHVAGDDAGQVWASANRLVARWTGTAWKTLTLPDQKECCTKGVVAYPDHLFGAEEQWIETIALNDGGTPKVLHRQDDDPCTAASVGDSFEILAGASDRTLLVGCASGSLFKLTPSPDGGAFAKDVLYAGPAGLDHFTLGKTRFFEEIWSRTPDDAFMIGFPGLIVHYDGTAAQLQHTALDGDRLTCTLRGIWGPSADEQWAVGDCNGDGLLMHRYAGDHDR